MLQKRRWHMIAIWREKNKKSKEEKCLLGKVRKTLTYTVYCIQFVKFKVGRGSCEEQTD